MGDDHVELDYCREGHVLVGMITIDTTQITRRSCAGYFLHVCDEKWPKK